MAKYKLVYGNFTGFLKEGSIVGYNRRFDGEGQRFSKLHTANSAFNDALDWVSNFDRSPSPVLMRLTRKGWAVVKV